MRLTHHAATSSILRAIVPVAGLGFAAIAGGSPVVGKEMIAARFDAPIAWATPGGTTLLVGLTVTLAAGDTEDPIEGSPVYLLFNAPDRTTTLAFGREGPAGHYTFRIDVPAGGIRDVEVGIRGNTSLPVSIVGTALVPGGITARTAQVAPAPVPATTRIARATSPAAPAAVPVAPALVPAAGPAAVPAAEPPNASTPVPVVVGLVAIALAAVSMTATAVRRARRDGRGAALRRTNGA